MSLPQPTAEQTPIPGLLVIRIPLLGDARGWFKENWQREKMMALGLPDFGPVQNNMSWNAQRGATRGIHAEPWDKFVSVAHGRVYAAWVDLREGDSFGATFSAEVDPGVAVFVPRGVANSYQALEDDTVYTYLVNEHWRPGVAYPAVNLADEAAAIPWPIPLDSPEVEISEKDRNNPGLTEASAMAPLKTLVLGGRGQLGRALQQEFSDAEVVTRDELDITDAAAVDAWPWHDYQLVINAAAWTAVDAAESPEGRAACWAANAVAPGHLARVAARHRLTLVQFSSDYVFDGTRQIHTEDEPLSPLGVYGQAKAAGEVVVTTAPRHYLLRTSWVVGDGNNFVRTMARLADNGVSPKVVDDQFGRLTFTTELSRAVRHLVDSGAPYGTYNATNAGPVQSWLDIARDVFELRGRPASDVTGQSTADYSAGKTVAPRPAHSALSLDKLVATGFEPRDAAAVLKEYVAAIPQP